MKIAEIDTLAVLLASIESCLQVVLLCLTGYLCAKYDIIPPKTQEVLSKLVIKVLMPCLLFSNIGFEIDAAKIIELWPVLFFYVVFFLCSGLFGLLGGSILRLGKSKTKFVMAGIIFNNVTSLSLGLLRGIEKTSIMEILTWGEDDPPSEAIKRGTSYVLLSTLLGNLLRWSIGVYLLKRDENEDAETIITNSENINIDNDSSDSNNNINNNSTSIIIPSSSSKKVKASDESTPLIKNESRGYINNNNNGSTTIILSQSDNMKNDYSDLERSSSQSFGEIIPIGKRFLNKINGVMNPPLYAALFALFVGLTPPLKALVFGENSSFYLTITVTMEYIGSIAVPLTLITLGAQVKNLPRGRGQQMLPAINYIMACRFVLMPIIGIVTILLTRSWYISDPMFLFVLILLACGPSAVNCINLTQLTGTFQEEMATLLFYSYIAVVPMITLLLIVVLTIISKVASE